MAIQFRRALLLMACLAIAASGWLQPPKAHADEDDIRELTIVSHQGILNSKLELSFDEAITRRQADALKAKMQVARPAKVSNSIGCGDYHEYYDTQGSMTLQLSCGTTYATLAWGWKMAVALRPTVVGNLNESGMIWSRNNEIQSQLSPHSEPPDYLFHGSLHPMWVGNVIEYLDYYDYRHNIGSGGNARITVYGTLSITY